MQMRSIIKTLLLLTGFYATTIATTAHAAAPGFTRGMNTELLFTRLEGTQCVMDVTDEKPLDNILPDIDNPDTPKLKALLAAGVDHIRIPVEFHFLYQPQSSRLPGPIKPSYLRRDNATYLMKYIKLANSVGMNVIFDLHIARLNCGDEDDGIYSKFLELQEGESNKTVEKRRAIFQQFWQELAFQIHSQSNPDKVIIEPMNEPVFDGYSAQWNAYQIDLVRAIRNSAPNHRVIMTGSYWSNIDALTGMANAEDGRGPFAEIKPLLEATNGKLDSKVVYNFHIYDPFVLTHQGASWDAPYNQLSYVPFRPTATNMQAFFDRFPASTRLGKELRKYLVDFDDANVANNIPDLIATRLNKVQAWAQRNAVPSTQLIATEFGIFPEKVGQFDYLRYSRYLRAEMEKRQIGWSVYYGQSLVPSSGAHAWTPDSGNGNPADDWLIFRNDVRCALALIPSMPCNPANLPLPEPVLLVGEVPSVPQEQ